MSANEIKQGFITYLSELKNPNGQSKYQNVDLDDVDIFSYKNELNEYLKNTYGQEVSIDDILNVDLSDKEKSITLDDIDSMAQAIDDAKNGNYEENESKVEDAESEEMSLWEKTKNSLKSFWNVLKDASIEYEEIKSQEFEFLDELGLDINEWNQINAKKGKDIAFIKNNTYSFETESGVKVTFDNYDSIEDAQVFENKETGEVIIFNADGAKITSEKSNVQMSIYNSEINSIETKKGNDTIKIYDSEIYKINTGKGNDEVTISNSEITQLNTSSGNDIINIDDSTLNKTKTNSNFLWGWFDGSADTVNVQNTEIGTLKTGKADDTIVVTDSEINKLKTNGGTDSVALNNTEITKTDLKQKDLKVENGEYLKDFNKETMLNIQSDANIQINETESISLTDYTKFLLNQEVGFETEEEYQEYMVQSLTTNLETMKEVFLKQEDKDGIVSDGYNYLKELSGFGITDKDIEDLITKQEKIIEGLTAAINGESNMSFEEAYEYYTGATYSQEKIDKYMELSNVYTAVMTGYSTDEDYIKKFEAATGKSVEDIIKEYALCETETFGNANFMKNLVEEYSEDQNNYADKLSSALMMGGMTLRIVGKVLTFTGIGAPLGLALNTLGMGMSISGMFVDNALDLVDDATDSDGLTKEEIKDIAIETTVESLSFAAGRKIGKLTQGINNKVNIFSTLKGFNGKILGQIAETTLDAPLSLFTDYAITQGQSFVTNGEFIDNDEYWSIDRFTSEGFNQLMGIFIGIDSVGSKNTLPDVAILNIKSKILDGDFDGAKTDLKNFNIDLNQKTFDELVKYVQKSDIETNDIKIKDDVNVKAQDISANGTSQEIKIDSDNDQNVDKNKTNPLQNKNTNISFKQDIDSPGKVTSLLDITNQIKLDSNTSFQKLKMENPEKALLVEQVLANTQIHTKTETGVTQKFLNDYVNRIIELDTQLLDNVVKNKIPVELYDDITLYKNVGHAAYSEVSVLKQRRVKDPKTNEINEIQTCEKFKRIYFSERYNNGPITKNKEIINSTDSVAHEFGHAFDYARRTDLGLTPQDSLSGKSIDISKLINGEMSTEEIILALKNDNIRFELLTSMSKEFDTAIEKDIVRTYEYDRQQGLSEGTTFENLLKDPDFKYYFGVSDTNTNIKFDDIKARKELFAQMSSYVTSGEVSNPRFQEHIENLFPNMIEFTKSIYKIDEIPSKSVDVEKISNQTVKTSDFNTKVDGVKNSYDTKTNSNNLFDEIKHLFDYKEIIDNIGVQQIDLTNKKFYHGTNFADSIRENGFQIIKSDKNLNLDCGNGIYLTSDISKASGYGADVLQVDCNLQNIAYIDSYDSFLRLRDSEQTLARTVFKIGKEKGLSTREIQKMYDNQNMILFNDFIPKIFQENGYDGVYIAKDSSTKDYDQLIIFDTSKINKMS